MDEIENVLTSHEVMLRQGWEGATTRAALRAAITSALAKARAEARVEVERLLRAINLAAETESGNAKVLIAVSRRAEKAESALSAMTAEANRYREREEYFAKALRVADGGQYRADWPGAIERLLRERDEAEARGRAKGIEEAAKVCEAQADACSEAIDTLRQCEERDGADYPESSDDQLFLQNEMLDQAGRIRSLLPAAPSTKEGER